MHWATHLHPLINKIGWWRPLNEDAHRLARVMTSVVHISHRAGQLEYAFPISSPFCDAIMTSSVVAWWRQSGAVTSQWAVNVQVLSVGSCFCEEWIFRRPAEVDVVLVWGRSFHCEKERLWVLHAIDLALCTGWAEKKNVPTLRLYC